MVLVEYVELSHEGYVESLVRTCSFLRYHTRVDRVINIKSQQAGVSIRYILIRATLNLLGFLFRKGGLRCKSKTVIDTSKTVDMGLRQA